MQTIPCRINIYLYIPQGFHIVDCGPHAPQTWADLLKPLFCYLGVLKTKWLPYSSPSFKAPGALPQLHFPKEMMCTPSCKNDAKMGKWVN